MRIKCCFGISFNNREAAFYRRMYAEFVSPFALGWVVTRIPTVFFLCRNISIFCASGRASVQSSFVPGTVSSPSAPVLPARIVKFAVAGTMFLCTSYIV